MSRTPHIHPASTPQLDLVPSHPKAATGAADTQEMALYGITCVPVNYYHYRGFRYTSLQDAVAQARRCS